MDSQAALGNVLRDRVDSQAALGNVLRDRVDSQAALGNILRDRVECILMSFSERIYRYHLELN